MNKILSLTRRCVEDYNMISPGDRIAVGVSGGKDSLMLLAALAKLREFYPIPYTVEAFTLDMGHADGIEPLDFSPIGALCQELGPEVVIQGGPRAQLIQMGSREEIRAESKRILDEVKPVSRTFIFRDGNDIPPYTPLENIQALYDACLEFGRYE